MPSGTPIVWLEDILEWLVLHYKLKKEYLNNKCVLFSCHYYYFKLLKSYFVFSFLVFAELLVGLINMSMSSAMASEQGSSMSSQQKQQMEAMRDMMTTDSFTTLIVISMIVGLIIGLASKFLLWVLFQLMQGFFQ